MRLNNLKTVVVASIVFLISCSQESNNSNANSGEEISPNIKELPFDSKDRSKIEVPNLASDDFSKEVRDDQLLLAKFQVHSDEIKEENDALGKEIINLEINEWLRSNFYIEEEDYQIGSLDTLIKRYELFLKAEKEAIGFSSNWEIDASADVVYSKNGFIQYALRNYSYTGGAHGNTTVIYRTYDVLTGARVELHQIFRDTLEIKKILNERFLPDEMNDGGFDLYVEEIPLTSNVILGTDSLTFFYNTYEIAPYSAGSIKFSIANNDLKSNLKIKLD